MLRALVLLCVATCGAAGAQTSAQGTSTDTLGAICSGLLAESPGTVSGDKAKLCTCLIRETPARLSQQEMMAYAEASLESKTPPDAVMQKVLAIATACLKEAQ